MKIFEVCEVIEKDLSKGEWSQCVEPFDENHIADMVKAITELSERNADIVVNTVWAYGSDMSQDQKNLFSGSTDGAFQYNDKNDTLLFYDEPSDVIVKTYKLYDIDEYTSWGDDDETQE